MLLYVLSSFTSFCSLLFDRYVEEHKHTIIKNKFYIVSKHRVNNKLTHFREYQKALDLLDIAETLAKEGSERSNYNTPLHKSHHVSTRAMWRHGGSTVVRLTVVLQSQVRIRCLPSPQLIANLLVGYYLEMALGHGLTSVRGNRGENYEK